MKDGFLNKCKQCCKNFAHKRHLVKLEDSDWVEKEKERHREKFHRLGKNWKKSSKDSVYEATKKYRGKFPEKYLARNRADKLECPKGLHRHHWSYKDEHHKDFIPLAIKDHFLLHRHMKYDQERLMYRGLDGILLDTSESHKELLSQLKS